MLDNIIYVVPTNNMSLLSQTEIAILKDNEDTDLYKLFRDCALAVLAGDENTGDNPEHLLKDYRNFEIDIIQMNNGIKLKLTNPPKSAFVNGQIIEGIKESLCSVLRDILFVHSKIALNKIAFDNSYETTNSIFKILRNADVFNTVDTNLIVCWGGHSIKRNEYEYTKKVGYELGLLGFDIATGCGLGAMKGPMKGATIAHAKTRKKDPRYIGISEPGIIASESPNPIVNKLLILPDIEKRLETFARLAHGIIIFPGGAGTAEEILYLIGILMNPENKRIPYPVILTGPEESKDYILKIHDFIGKILGKEAQNLYTISFNEKEVANIMKNSIQKVKEYREEKNEASYFNWGLRIERDFQIPFPLVHEEIEKLNLSLDMPKHELACNLRRIFSVIVAGNIKPDGINAVRINGPFKVSGDKIIMTLLDELLTDFIKQERMKLPDGEIYKPCYKIIKKSP